MPILLPVGVANALNTPAAYTGLIADIPNYNDVQIGTIYIGTDNASIQTATAGGWVALGTGGGGGSQDLQQTLNNGNSTTLSAVFNNGSLTNVIDGQYCNFGDGLYLSNLVSCNGLQISNTFQSVATNINADQFNITQNEFITNITPAIANFNDTSLFLVSEISPGWVFVQSNVTNAYGNLKIVGGQALLILGNPPTNRQITIGSDFITFKDLASDKTQSFYPNVEFNEQGVNLPANDGVLALQNPPATNVDLSIGTYTINGQKQQTYIIEDVGNDIFLDANQWENNYTVTLLVKSSGFSLIVTGVSSFHGNPAINLEGIYFITYITSDDAFFCSNI